MACRRDDTHRDSSAVAAPVTAGDGSGKSQKTTDAVPQGTPCPPPPNRSPSRSPGPLSTATTTSRRRKGGHTARRGRARRPTAPAPEPTARRADGRHQERSPQRADDQEAPPEGLRRLPRVGGALRGRAESRECCGKRATGAGCPATCNSQTNASALTLRSPQCPLPNTPNVPPIPPPNTPPQIPAQYPPPPNTPPIPSQYPPNTPPMSPQYPPHFQSVCFFLVDGFTNTQT